MLLLLLLLCYVAAVTVMRQRKGPTPTLAETPGMIQFFVASSFVYSFLRFVFQLYVVVAVVMVSEVSARR